MKKRIGSCMLLFLLCAVLFVSCTADSAANEKMAEAVAQGFSECYTPIRQSNPMMLGQGKAFLAELTGDDAPEAVILYDNHHTAGAMVLSPEGNVLAQFETTSFYHDTNLAFSIYAGPKGKVLASRAIEYGSAPDERTAVTEEYLSFSADQVEQRQLFYIANEKTGDLTYFESPQSSQIISAQEFQARSAQILGDGELLETIELKKQDEPVDLMDAAGLQSYLLEQLDRYNGIEP